MEVCRTVKELKTRLKSFRSEGKTIGFVPTMGALHEGHLSLLDFSEQGCDITVCSIYVNPTQFNNPEDLIKYPRTPDQDIQQLESASCDVVFVPENREIYPEPDDTVYDFGELGRVMEGRFRPGHFNGVAMVVKKLFDIVEPHRAYFGQKDYQQLLIVRELAKQYQMDIEVVGCPIVRERDGLAMSSRNVRLNQEERKVASGIYQNLIFAKKNAGKMTVDQVKKEVERRIDNIPGMKTEYFEIADAETLKPVSDWKASPSVIACIAVFLGNVRLIDNMLLF